LTSDCQTACSHLGLDYDPATATIAGSEGTDANCRFILQGFGVPGSEGLEAPSAPCAAGLGCFADTADVEGIVPFEGRCASPPTDAASRQTLTMRACACR